MADNFNLRKFLSENKLTKNAKILSEEEQQEGYQPKSKLEQIIQQAWAEKDLNKAKQMVIDFIEPSRVKSKDQIISTLKTIANKPKLDQYLANSLLKFEKLGLSEGDPLANRPKDGVLKYPEEYKHMMKGREDIPFTDSPNQLRNTYTNQGAGKKPRLPEEAEDIKEGGNWGITLDGKLVDINSIEIDGMDPEDRPDYSDAYIAYAEFEDGTELTPEELDRLDNENYGLIHDLIFDRGLDEAKKEPVNEAINYDNLSKHSIKDLQSTLSIKQDELKKLSGKEDAPPMLKGKIKELKDQIGKLEKAITSKKKETIKESKMTQREKYLTRLVENALGLEGYGDDNVNKQREKQGLPPAQGPKYSEGVSEDGMVEEKPLPKYENIEKLMQEIDKSTDEEAHKFKMQEMKRVADMLEKKCTALEEGEDADHIDQKKLKQMKKDIMTLRKGIEKMEKIGEKKFAKKETKAELKEGFDLRNFLVENKMTRNSRMVSEEYADGLPPEGMEILEAAIKALDALDEFTAIRTDEVLHDAVVQTAQLLRGFQPTYVH
jgi:hypothetical protein